MNDELIDITESLTKTFKQKIDMDPSLFKL